MGKAALPWTGVSERGKGKEAGPSFTDGVGKKVLHFLTFSGGACLQNLGEGEGGRKGHGLSSIIRGRGREKGLCDAGLASERRWQRSVRTITFARNGGKRIL